MTKFARGVLRNIFLEADMGISGGNFVIAETGTVCLVTNEGNGRMVTSMPRVHVALVGIEKIVATLEDYATLTQVLPRSATGQTMTVYTSMISGPRRPGDPDGPDHVYVIFLDNGRSNVYATEYAEALACIRCGACLNACPVYRSTGGHAYGWVYPGPIGAVITPLLNGLAAAKPLPHASSLCGSCKQVCPVDIDLPRMLLDLRRDLYDQNKVGAGWKLAMKLWAFGFRSPRLFAFGGSVARAVVGNNPPSKLPPPLSGWTKYRDLPAFAPKSFHQQWQERRGKSHE
jgi:L-lactate dehydrogenase complex protein LldF